MRTQKRAKSVSFGKKKETPAPSVAEPKEPKETASNPSPDSAQGAADVEAPHAVEPQKKIEETPTKIVAEEKPTETVDEKISEPEKVSPEQAAKPEEKEDLLEQAKKMMEQEPVESKQPDTKETSESPQTVGTTEEQAEEPKAAAGQADEPKEESDGSAFYVQDSHLHMPERTHKKKSKFLLQFLVIALVSFVLGLGGVAAVDYALNNKGGNKKMDFKEIFTKLAPQQPTPTATPTPEVEPTSKPVDLSKHAIRVLNGSGVTGRAAKLKAELEDAGFTISTTGNADNSNYTKTKIVAKKSVSEEFIKKLEETLKKSYVLDKTSRLSDSASPDVDVTVTIGKETTE